jgi:hypothetical protein
MDEHQGAQDAVVMLDHCKILGLLGSSHRVPQPLARQAS